MDIFSSPDALQQHLNLASKSGPLVFVPTMGALHEGHLSLVKTARKYGNTVLVSIFVNPSQFGPNEDFDAYPRDLQRDKDLCKQAGVDILFTPTVSDIFPDKHHKTEVRVPGLSELYCGASRPQFFGGITTVLLRFFNIIRPDCVILGEKDYQQYVIVKHCVRDLFLPIQVQTSPLIRETYGLAMSSRNAYLSTEQKEKATTIYQGLQAARALFDSGETHVEALLTCIKTQLSPEIRLDYLVCVHPESLLPVSQSESGSRFLFAGTLGPTRLIDTLAL